MDRGRIAIWAGIEPSVVRVGSRFIDQVRRTGHHDRLDDLRRLFELGIAGVRYPILWERVAPDGLAGADWRWSDERLEYLKSLGVEPIVTLLHHGSGPRYTDLLDKDFPAKLAQYAAAVARRYPWVKKFTPVNEPLTTARFSALYGHWYPHKKEDAAFMRVLLNEVAGIARSMEAIRRETPDALLVQTEDIGKTHSTAKLQYQAELENERRWMTIDLLCGGVERNTSAHKYLASAGLDLDQAEFATYRCPPDILGFNYYVTGERFLDHRIHRYPAPLRGGNGRDEYADTEAVRVCPQRMAGIYNLLLEAWQRYRRPLAITEAHLGCAAEEQVRWLEEIYKDAIALVRSGVDVRAMTVWAAFGAVDWNSLLTREDDIYEPGCFDIRHTPPLPTLVAQWTRARSAGQPFNHPALDGLGWWRLPSAAYYEDLAV